VYYKLKDKTFTNDLQCCCQLTRLVRNVRGKPGHSNIYIENYTHTIYVYIYLHNDAGESIMSHTFGGVGIYTVWWCDCQCMIFQTVCWRVSVKTSPLPDI